MNCKVTQKLAYKRIVAEETCDEEARDIVFECSELPISIVLLGFLGMLFV